MPTTTNPLDTLSFEEWDALIISIMRRFIPLCYSNAVVDPDDLKQEAWTALLRAVKNFDPDKAARTGVKFSTYAYVYVNGQLCRFIKRAFERPDHCDIDNRHIGAEDICPDEQAEKDELVIKIFDFAQDKPHAYLIEEHFVKGKSYRTIASEMGVSHALIHLRLQSLLHSIGEELDDNN